MTFSGEGPQAMSAVLHLFSLVELAVLRGTVAGVFLELLVEVV